MLTGREESFLCRARGRQRFMFGGAAATVGAVLSRPLSATVRGIFSGRGKRATAEFSPGWECDIVTADGIYEPEKKSVATC